MTISLIESTKDVCFAVAAAPRLRDNGLREPGVHRWFVRHADVDLSSTASSEWPPSVMFPFPYPVINTREYMQQVMNIPGQPDNVQINPTSDLGKYKKKKMMDQHSCSSTRG